METKERITEIMEGPKTITLDNIQHWCNHSKKLEKTRQSKAKKLVEYDLIRYIGSDSEFGSKYTFIILPINRATDWPVMINGEIRLFNKKPYPRDYNKNVYKVYRNQEGLWSCSCQGWSDEAKRARFDDGVYCCHVLGLFYAFKMKRFGTDHGATDKQTEADR